ncbi:hypothetical protein [Thalassobacillus pellis]|uniref:hypothetical protein n=1 Tax=Thalassobacillus pellis TaxID=748008 RepID=UPI00196227BE|nr:hypothetical protein [Thalassobacillus pellis]MBM7554042.1 hypothetical protein [Thalassobacillus pellis]
MAQRDNPNDRRAPFDDLMFGQRRREGHQEDQKSEEKSSVDLMSIVKSMADTYSSFTPYIKNLSETIKKFKK